MRLTEELPMGSYRAKTIYLEPNRNEQECIYKLGQLEDIEEGLDIEFSMLDKICKNGVYCYKRSIKDLTLKEMSKICSKHTAGGFACCEHSKCPLWHNNSCLKGFIEKLRYLESEAEINESNNN